VITRDSTYEEAFEFACEYLEDSGLTPDELRHAVMVGVSHVKSERPEEDDDNSLREIQVREV